MPDPISSSQPSRTQTIDMPDVCVSPRPSPGHPRSAARAHDRFETSPDANPACARTMVNAMAATRRQRTLATVNEALRQVRSIPAPPTRLEQLPQRPRSLTAFIREQREEAFREGVVATTSAFIGVAGAPHLGVSFHTGAILGRAGARGEAGISDAIETGEGLAHGVLEHAAEQVIEGAEHGLGPHAANAGDVHAAGGLASGALLLVHSTANALLQADERVEVAARESEWDRQHTEAVEHGRHARLIGSIDAQHAIENETPDAIDTARLRADGDYYRGVTDELERRASALARTTGR